MLDGRGHDSLSPPATRGRAAQHRQVIRLGAAGGKDNFPRLGAQGNGYRLPGMGDLSLGLQPLFMQRGRIAIALGHQLQHLFRAFFAHPGGGAVVQIDFLQESPSSRYELISLFSGLDGPEFLKTGLLYNKYKNQANKFAWQKKTE